MIRIPVEHLSNRMKNVSTTPRVVCGEYLTKFDFEEHFDFEEKAFFFFII